MRKLILIGLIATAGLFASNTDINVTKDTNKTSEVKNGGNSEIDKIIKQGKIIKEVKYVDKITGETKKVITIASDKGVVTITDTINKDGNIKSRIKEFTAEATKTVQELFKEMKSKIKTIDTEHNVTSNIKHLFEEIKNKISEDK